MSSYISSNENRFYVALEQEYGNTPAVSSGQRIPAVKLSVKQTRENVQRRDKTGSRTFAGYPAGMRKKTEFTLRSYLTSWTDTSQSPVHGPLFQAALGADPLTWNGGTIASATSSTLTFAAPHGLVPGQAVVSGGEMRFVATVPNASSVQLAAPFSAAPSAGASLGATVTYSPATELKSVSIFDYWTPGTAVQRLLSGAAIDKARINVNSDFHEFEFRGLAADIVDSASFQSGDASLTQFPLEPALGAFDYSIVPGHLGEVWLGSSPSLFQTVTSAELLLENDLDLRVHEFGSLKPRATAPGIRNISLAFSLFENNDDATRALYQVARNSTPIEAMIQLGRQTGQLFGAYLKTVVPEVPEFDDSERRLQWKFDASRAQGTLNDELFVAFG